MTNNISNPNSAELSNEEFLRHIETTYGKPLASVIRTRFTFLSELIEVYKLDIKWRIKILNQAKEFPVMHKPMCKRDSGTLCNCGLDRWKLDLAQKDHILIKELLENE